MASFNLGKIKGDKGEKGDIGPKGDKGEKGDRGERGADGNTPVFSIAQTETLESGTDAFVELDSSDASNPVLKFFIPKGRDGNDAFGDMQSAQYDKNGRKTDIFEYADKLSESAFKKDGGTFTGEVNAHSSLPEDICVRNISIGNALPGAAKNGDVCVLTKKISDITLGDIEPGSTLLIKENGSYHEYYVIAKNSYLQNGTALMRKKLLNNTVIYSKENSSTYSQSDIDMFLNTVVFNMFDGSIRDKMMYVPVESNLNRKIFLPTSTDITPLTNFEEGTYKANIDGGSAGTYWTRKIIGSANVYCVDTAGAFLSSSAARSYYIRPMFVLPSDIQVENTEVSSGIGYKLSEDKGGIYVLKNGEWSECEL